MYDQANFQSMCYRRKTGRLLHCIRCNRCNVCAQVCLTNHCEVSHSFVYCNPTELLCEIYRLAFGLLPHWFVWSFHFYADSMRIPLHSLEKDLVLGWTRTPFTPPSTQQVGARQVITQTPFVVPRLHTPCIMSSREWLQAADINAHSKAASTQSDLLGFSFCLLNIAVLDAAVWLKQGLNSSLLLDSLGAR